MTTLLALFRRPDGGPDALATFERRYAAEHLPLVAQTPGLRETRVRRVSEALGGETDLVLVTTMVFDDRASLDAGLGRMRCALPGGTCARSHPGWPRSSCSRTHRKWMPPLPAPWILSERTAEEPR